MLAILSQQWKIASADFVTGGLQNNVFYITCIDEQSKLAKVNDILSKNGRYNCIYHTDIYSGAWWCEILPQKTTKANAILRLKSLLGCEKIVAFGDGKNDITMFGIADECYAVSNAVAELKAIATAVIGCNNEDGVAKWLLDNVK